MSSGVMLSRLCWREVASNTVLSSQSHRRRYENKPASPLLRTKLRLLAPHLAVAADDVLIGRQFLESHRTAGVKLIRADADLRAEAKLAAVGKTGRSIPVDGGRIYLMQKSLRGRFVACHDAIAVVRAEALDMCDC